MQRSDSEHDAKQFGVMQAWLQPNRFASKKVTETLLQNSIVEIYYRGDV
jgi:hypothetical protein